MQIRNRRRLRALTSALLGLAVLAALAMPSTVLAQSNQGLKLTNKLIKSANSTIAEIAAARAQIEKTLSGYNEIVDGKVPNNTKAYKALKKDIDKCDVARGDVRTKMVDMQLAADGLFENWENDLAGFSSEEMKQRSNTRLEETKAGYDQIRQAANKAGAEFDPFLTNLRDQILFLGNDLNPAAIKELADDKTKLNAQATKVFASVDDATNTARQYVGKLTPQ